MYTCKEKKQPPNNVLQRVVHLGQPNAKKKSVLDKSNREIQTRLKMLMQKKGIPSCDTGQLLTIALNIAGTECDEEETHEYNNLDRAVSSWFDQANKLWSNGLISAPPILCVAGRTRIDDLVAFNKFVLWDKGMGNMLPAVWEKKDVLKGSADVSSSFPDFISDPYAYARKKLDEILRTGIPFYSKLALADELRHTIFTSLLGSTVGEVRPDQPYKVSYPEETDGALHHINPWSKIATDAVKAGRTKQEVSENSDLCWDEANLVAGPRDFRLFDPQSTRDLEAEKVMTTSKGTYDILDSATLDKTGRQVKAESPAAHMRTSMMQQLFLEAIRLIQTGSKIIRQKQDKVTIIAAAFEIEREARAQFSGFRIMLSKAIARFTKIETEFAAYEPLLAALLHATAGKDDNPEAYVPSLLLFTDRITMPIEELSEPDTSDELDPDLLLPAYQIMAIRRLFGPSARIVNPLGTGNNCFFGALCPDAPDPQAVRAHLRSLITDHPDALPDGAMIDYTDLDLLFTPNATGTTLAMRAFGIAGVRMFELTGNTLRHVRNYGQVNQDSPYIISVESLHYIRVFP